jgi:FAD-dependent oxidoreductase domain-containing protein 1
MNVGVKKALQAAKQLLTFVRTYSDAPIIERSPFYFKTLGKISREDRCTYQGNDILEKILPGAEDQKDPWRGIKNSPQLVEDIYPIMCDFLIVGGGVMGASVAYWLTRFHTGSKVVVVERDSNYTQAATVLSVGGVRQQFSLPENIQMSMYGCEFLRDAHRNLSVLGQDPPQVNYNPHGYLFLATEEGAAQLEENHQQQRLLGAKVALYSPTRLKEQFPWLNLKGIALGSVGLENEGWFDPWSLLNGFKRRAKADGAQFIEGEVIGFQFIDKRTRQGRDEVHDALVRKSNGDIQPLQFHKLVNAAGPWAGQLARLLKIGTDDIDDPDDVRTISLPVEPRKRYVYVLHCPDGPGINCPLVVDPSGLYFRREGLGGYYLCGISPEPHEEPPTDNLDVDFDYFQERVWPLLAERVPAFEKCKVKNAWAGFYDYNYYDENCIIGGHPYYDNVYFLNGFSGHGIQQAPAAGLALTELMTAEEYSTLDLSRFDFRRFIVGAKMLETNIV